MAIDGNVFPGTRFAFYIAPETTLGTINTTVNEYTEFDVTSVNDIDWASGITQDRTLKTGQRWQRDTDHFADTSGSTWTWDFEYIASDRNAARLLMSGISEGSESNTVFTSSADSAPLQYVNGGSTGRKFSILIANPQTGEDRAMTGAVLTQLTIGADKDSDGGRVKFSGQFMTGFKPVVATNATVTSIEGGSATKTRVDWEKTIFDLTTKQYNGADTVLESFEFSWAFPSTAKGWNSTGEAEIYARGNEATLEGMITTLYDGNTIGALQSFETATPVGVNLTGSNGFGITIPMAIPTNYTPDFAAEEGALVELPFKAVATGSGAVYFVTIV